MKKLCKCEKKTAPARSPGKVAAGILGKLALFGLGAFLVTFTIYMFNLENKLIYYVIRPFLNKHYDAQKRDRRIV